MKISIIGSNGSVGAPAAFYLAVQGLADEIVLIGRAKNVAQQHAMDLSTAASTRGLKIYSGDYPDMSGSRIVLIAAGVPQGLIKDRMELLPKNTELMRQFAVEIRKYCPNAIIMTATNPADPMNYAVYLAGQFSKNQVIGYTINDTYRFREFLAREYEVAVNRVNGYVIGEHGSSQVLLFSTAAIDGQPVSVSDEVKHKIYAEVPQILKRFEELKAGRTAGWTCAVGYEQMVRAVVEDANTVLPSSVVLEGEYGLSGFSMSVPAVLGKNGVQGIKEFKLEDNEKERLARSAEILRNAARQVEDQLL